MMTFVDAGQQLLPQLHHFRQIGIDHQAAAVVQPLEILAQAAAQIQEHRIRMLLQKSLRLVQNETRTDQYSPDAVAVL